MTSDFKEVDGLFIAGFNERDNVVEFAMLI